MASRKPKTAVFPGSFDPPTIGHIDLIQRCRRLFDKTIVAVGRNPEKAPMFTPEERVAMLRELLGNGEDVEVAAYEGLTMDYVHRQKADAIVKGIRDGEDLRNELRQANVNMLAGDIETVFLFTTDQTALVSSTLIRQIYEMGDVKGNYMSRFVPPLVLERLRQRLER